MKRSNIHVVKMDPMIVKMDLSVAEMYEARISRRKCPKEKVEFLFSMDAYRCNSYELLLASTLNYLFTETQNVN